jgi:hypothetical protein
MPTPKRKQIGLSKSRVMYGLQCPKRLYLYAHEPELAGPISSVQQAIFDQGTAVGILAQKEFPGGVLIAADHTASAKALDDTAAAIKNGANTIYEAAYQHGNVLVRVDILHRKPRSKSWNIIEVKSSTSAKDQYLDDVAVQTWVLRGAGVNIGSSSIMFINNQCTYPDLSDLFAIEDVTGRIEDRIATLPEKLKVLLATLQGKQPPDLDIGPHCSSPYDCPFTEQCWDQRKIPSPSIFEVPGLGEKAWDYYRDGIIKLTDPRLKGFSGTKGRAIDAARTGKRWIDPREIRNGIKSWKWPLYFLDFETIGPAVPRYKRTRPFQQVSFQFSCHAQDKPGAKLRHAEYLHMDQTDPRPAVAEHLVIAAGTKGSVVAYNMKTERGCIEHLADACPKLAAKLRAIIPRLVDPLPVIRNSVYDNGFRGSFSIKSVAPTLIGSELSYDNLDVGDGQQAQLAFDEMISPQTAPKRREEIKTAMLKYCQQDTLAMVKLTEWLFNQIGEGSRK